MLLEEAHVSVMDRGFTFGDGVYEVIPVFGNHIIRLSQHLSRLSNSLGCINMDNPYTEEKWRDIINELLVRNNSTVNRSIYIQVTRGVDEREHIYGEAIRPTVFIMCKPILEKDLKSGVSAITHEDIRWKYCHIKAITLLPGVLLKKKAKDTDGSFETILIKDKLVKEGAASNVFIVKDNIVKTPVKDGSLLPGITRDLLVELLLGSNIDCKEATITERELNIASEIWITSSTMGVIPVIKLDGEKVGDGKPGEIWKHAFSLYESYVFKA